MADLRSDLSLEVFFQLFLEISAINEHYEGVEKGEGHHHLHQKEIHFLIILASLPHFDTILFLKAPAFRGLFIEGGAYCLKGVKGRQSPVKCHFIDSHGGVQQGSVGLPLFLKALQYDILRKLRICALRLKKRGIDTLLDNFNINSQCTHNFIAILFRDPVLQHLVRPLHILKINRCLALIL